MTGPDDARRFAVAHELADARNQKRTQSTQTSRRMSSESLTSSESRTNSKSHMKSTLVPYKDQILDLAMHGGAFQAKAKADAAFRQAATKDTAELRHTAIKVNAELVA
jgi:hypothetical protein